MYNVLQLHKIHTTRGLRYSGWIKNQTAVSYLYLKCLYSFSITSINLAIWFGKIGNYQQQSDLNG